MELRAQAPANTAASRSLHRAYVEAIQTRLTELEEEHSGEEAAFSGFDDITAAAVKDRFGEIGHDSDAAGELAVLRRWQSLSCTCATRPVRRYVRSLLTN